MEKLGRKAFGWFTEAHVAAYRKTGGRIGRTFLRGTDICLVDHVGRRSGEDRTTPLIYIRDADAVVIVASNGGAPSHPAWLHNLRAHPQTTVQVRSERWPVAAREATDPEREQLWPRLDDAWPDYEGYRARADRKIPIVLLEPRPA